MAIENNTIHLQDLLLKMSLLPNISRDMDFENIFIARKISDYENSRITIIGEGAFERSNLISASFPNCITIDSQAFWQSTYLISVNFPNCATINYGAFYQCFKLTSVNFPNCTSIGYSAFSGCSRLTSVNFPNCNSIFNDVFKNCYRLSQLYLTGSSLCRLYNSNAFSSTPFTGYSSYFSGIPHIYVPKSLVTSYQSATNWAYFSSYISAYEDILIKRVPFFIDEVEYQTEKDMTWSEWVESDYNTGGFYIDDNDYVYNGEYWVWEKPSLSGLEMIYAEKKDAVIDFTSYYELKENYSAI